MIRTAFSLARRATLALLPWLALAADAEEQFLPPQQAYRFEAGVADGEMFVRFDIEPGYYLYRDRLGLETTTPGVTLGPLDLPEGEDHEDAYFGRQVIYRGRPVVSAKLDFEGPPRPFDLTLKLQGCADGGLCYPPQRWTRRIAVGEVAAAPATAAAPAIDRKGFDLKGLLRGGPNSESDFLPVDQAFVLTAESDRVDRVILDWQVADGYYLYRDKVKVVAPGGEAQLGKPSIPGGRTQHDDYFGEQVVFFDRMVAQVPVAVAPGTREVTLEVSYQGCAEAGLCYPPTRKELKVALAAPGSGSAQTDASPPRDGFQSEQDALAERIRSGNLLAVLATFFGAGLLLAFTPCVLPMVPILSGIIVGAGRDRPVSRGRAFSLSLAYVLGMALTYTVAGAAFAAAGQQAQAFFQEPWIIALFAGLFVVLALGMFGAFNLQVPAALQARIADTSNRQKQGTLAGTAVMGSLSSLIVTACVAPPLVAALAVIGQSGDVVRGGAALFALSLGMGAPLLIVGASAGRLLPKAGPWMEAVKIAFGVMMLGVAVWMLGRILPGPATLALWAVLAFVTGYYLFIRGGRAARGGTAIVSRGLGALVALYGVALLFGALSGRSDPLQPLAGVGTQGEVASQEHLAFRRIKTVDDFDRALAEAQSAGRPVMLDFYADWCVSCKEMEHRTFTDAGVQAALAGAVLLQADVTANDEADQALLQRFGILGPPTIVFFGPTGDERRDYRVVGFKPADEFRSHVAQAFGSGA